MRAVVGFTLLAGCFGSPAISGARAGSSESAPPLGPRPPPSTPKEREGSHCVDGEAVAYTCAIDAKVVSVCVGPRTTAYRFGAIGKIELEISSDGRDGRAHLGELRGGGGGAQTSVRFSANGYDYLVYSADAGSLTEHPGASSSGVVVLKGTAEVGRLTCAEHGPHQRLSASDLPIESETGDVGWQ